MIMEFEITKMGERGQVVIPQSFREHLKLEKGEKFMVIEEGENLLLKRIKPPTKDEFEKLIRKTHEHARKYGITEEDMREAIKRARKK